MVVCFWSPKGGSGTSTVVAACAGVLREMTSGVRLVDLAGDQPALLGLDTDPRRGVADWLALGAAAPSDALERLAVATDGGITLLPLGDGTALWESPPEAGAALVAVLATAPVPAVIDLGRAEPEVARAVATVADRTWAVCRPCYPTLRRFVQHELRATTAGVVFVDEPGRTLKAGLVADVAGRPVVATVPWRAAIARRADAGRAGALPYDAVWSPLRDLVRPLVRIPDGGAAA
jgi:hypothetical protein